MKITKKQLEQLVEAAVESKLQIHEAPESQVIKGAPKTRVLARKPAKLEIYKLVDDLSEVIAAFVGAQNIDDFRVEDDVWSELFTTVKNIINKQRRRVDDYVAGR